MLIDFQPMFRKEITFADLASQYSNAGLATALNAYVDFTRQIIHSVSDEQATFVPSDLDAHDPYAASEADQHAGWSLVHLVAHVTASAEEAAAFSSILARGIAIGGRLRKECDWRQMTTCVMAATRLEECRRTCLGYLATWPEPPDLATTRIMPENTPWPAPNATGSFLVGLMHWSVHIPQFQKTAEQARLPLNQDCFPVVISGLETHHSAGHNL